jgi:hypothetical protein
MSRPRALLDGSGQLHNHGGCDLSDDKRYDVGVEW